MDRARRAVRDALVAAALGLSAIACVAGPFAVVGQRHAPKPKSPPPVTHTTPPPVIAVASATVTEDPAPVPEPPHTHTFRVADLASDSRYAIAQGAIGKHGFLGALAASGLAPREAHRVLAGFSGVKNLDRLNANDAFSYAKSSHDGHVVAFELLPANEASADSLDFFQEHEDDTGAPLVAKHVSIAIDKKRLKAAIVVGSDLRASLTAAGFNESITNELDDALEGHAELSDLQKGTRLRLVATEERVEGAFSAYAIDAVEYSPPGKPAVRVYAYGPPSSRAGEHEAQPSAHDRAHGSRRVARGFYDAQGRQPYHGAWRSPIPMARISSRFNPNRMHPVLHVVMPHNGVDFAAPPGTPVYAAASGTLRSVGDGGPCGNMVQIEHPNGLISAYCHLSRFGPISAGQHVETRQLIGYVGQTGRATGPHLHFAVKRVNAAGTEIFIDPLSMRLDGVRLVSNKDDFEKARVALDAELDSITLPAAAEPPPAENDAAQGNVENGAPND